MWKAIARDRFVRTFALVAAVLWLPFYLPFSPVQQLSPLVWRYLQALLLVLGIAACLWHLGRLTNVIERRFWRLIALSLGCWLGVQLLETSIDSDWSHHFRLSLLGIE